MIYRSHLRCPDLTPYFKHLISRPMAHSFGHDVPSDWGDKADDDPMFGIYKRCGMWTHDEAAILYQVARRVQGDWVDIGAHTGWTTRHIVEAICGGNFDAVEPMFAVEEFMQRFSANLGREQHSVRTNAATSDQYFGQQRLADVDFDGFVIDGCHEPGQPLRDAQNSVKHLAPTGVIMLHDGVGRPVRQAVEWLMCQGFKARAYFTPHLVFCCWRGNFAPPLHVPDPNVKRQLLDGRFRDFDFEGMV